MEHLLLVFGKHMWYMHNDALHILLYLPNDIYINTIGIDGQEEDSRYHKLATAFSRPNALQFFLQGALN